MPVRKANRHFYGRVWREHVRPRILARATVSTATAVGATSEARSALDETTTARVIQAIESMDRVLQCECTGLCGHHAGRCPEIDRVCAQTFSGRVVLSVAHLDQDPSNNDDSNLRAVCQSCHNRIDAPYRGIHAWETRHRERYADLGRAGQHALPFDPQVPFSFVGGAQWDAFVAACERGPVPLALPTPKALEHARPPEPTAVQLDLPLPLAPVEQR